MNCDVLEIVVSGNLMVSTESRVSFRIVLKGGEGNNHCTFIPSSHLLQTTPKEEACLEQAESCGPGSAQRGTQV